MLLFLDAAIVIREEPTPQRYHSESSAGCHTVEVPDNLLSKRYNKPAVLLLNPLSDLPQFSGDLSSIIVTSLFSQCFKPPSDKVRIDWNTLCSLIYRTQLRTCHAVTWRELTQLISNTRWTEGLRACETNLTVFESSAAGPMSSPLAYFVSKAKAW